MLILFRLKGIFRASTTIIPFILLSSSPFPAHKIYTSYHVKPLQSLVSGFVSTHLVLIYFPQLPTHPQCLGTHHIHKIPLFRIHGASVFITVIGSSAKLSLWFLLSVTRKHARVEEWRGKGCIKEEERGVLRRNNVNVMHMTFCISFCFSVWWVVVGVHLHWLIFPSDHHFICPSLWNCTTDALPNQCSVSSHVCTTSVA